MAALEILISTLNAGIKNAAKVPLAPHPEICYLVVWQQTEDFMPCEIPAALAVRGDVRVITQKGRGLCRSRNFAIENARAEYVLITDDDVTFHLDGVLTALKQMQNHPYLDFATFKVNTNKHYPATEFIFNEKTPKGYYASSLEMMMHRQSIAGKVRFNELFGLGAPVLSCGEEDLWIHDALNAGLKGGFFPIVIVSHLHDSTSTTQAAKPGVLMALGAYIYLKFKSSPSLLPRLLLAAWRKHKTTELGFFKSLSLIIDGAKYIRKHNG